MRWNVWLVAGVVFSLSACRGGGTGGPCETDCTSLPENQAPTAKIVAPKVARTGQEITIDASKSTDPEGQKLKYLWLEGEKNPANNFLDGLDLTESKLTFTPDVEGKFTYTVEVKDSEGLKDTAEVTIEVDSDYVPPELKAPTITAVVINGITYNFSTTPAPVVFTTATGVLTIKALGTDSEDDADSIPLSTAYSANVTGATTVNGRQLWVGASYNAAEDDDPFSSTTFTVQTQDSNGLKSAAKTVEVRIVPRANAQLAPLASFVDCSALPGGDGLTPLTPTNSLADGYAVAMANGLTDVFVAADLPVEEGGTACKGTQVDFHGIRLWGLFNPQAAWRRMTEQSDKLYTNIGEFGRRYGLQTTIQDPQAYKLIYATGSTYTTGSLLIDGFRFNLSGWNYYGVSLTVGTGSDTIDVGLWNNEFTGNVTSVTATFGGAGIGWVPGGVLIQRNTATSSSGSAYILRNLFAVNTTDSASVIQAWVDASNRTKSAGAIYFYANVFTGSVKSVPLYKCLSTLAAGRFPVAFCLHQYNAGEATVARNSFWGRAITNTTIPSIISAGNGRIRSYGNQFGALGSPYPIRFSANAADANFPNNVFGRYFYSAFPTDTTNGILVHETRYDTNAAITSASCVTAAGVFWTGATCTGSTVNSLLGTGSFFYDYGSLLKDGSQPWRAYSPTALDVFTEDSIGLSGGGFDPFARWDFDGYYGPKDNGTGNGAKYNAGAFEALQ